MGDSGGTATLDGRAHILGRTDLAYRLYQRTPHALGHNMRLAAARLGVVVVAARTLGVPVQCDSRKTAAKSWTTLQSRNKLTVRSSEKNLLIKTVYAMFNF